MGHSWARVPRPERRIPMSPLASTKGLVDSRPHNPNLCVCQQPTRQLEHSGGFLVTFEFVKLSSFSSIFSFVLNDMSGHIYRHIMYLKVAQSGTKHLNLHCYNCFFFLVIFLWAQNSAF